MAVSKRVLKRNKLVLENKRVADINATIRKYDGKEAGLMLEDLEQEGVLGLLHGAKKYRRSKGASFSTYGAYWARSYVTAVIRRNLPGYWQKTNSGLPRLASFEQKILPGNISYSEVIPGKPDRKEHEMYIKNLMNAVNKAFEKLTETQKTVILMRFFHKPAPLTLQRIGDILGVVRERVRQHEKTALEKLRSELEKEGFVWIH